jgi:hypothetical protein
VKNQYVGDINDFRKYGLLRTLSREGEIRTGVCWMLTPDDTRNDGQFISYLGTPRAWQAYDPVLFDHLAACVREPEGRNIGCIEEGGILPNTLFHSEILRDSLVERRRYFAEMHARFADRDLVFFDPDNGLEIKSCLTGRKNSGKFLYWSELVDTYAAGSSVLVYQHFIRENRDRFIMRIASEILQRTGAPAVLAFRTPHVVFLLAMQSVHRAHLERQAAQVAQVWQEQIQLTEHRAAQQVVAADVAR